MKPIALVISLSVMLMVPSLLFGQQESDDYGFPIENNKYQGGSGIGRGRPLFPLFGRFHNRSTLLQSSRRYSYAPVDVVEGDEVFVKKVETKIMSGKNVVGTVGKGERFTVKKIVRGWLRVDIKVDGKELKGWIWNKNVTQSPKVTKK